MLVSRGGGRGRLQAAVESVAADGQQLVHAESAHRYCTAVQQYVPRRTLLLPSRSHVRWRRDGRASLPGCEVGCVARARLIYMDTVGFDTAAVVSIDVLQ